MESRSTNLEDRRQKVLDFINVNGPSLPVKIATHLKSDSLIVGALLSELTKEKELFLSSMRVGNSPLYYMRGQEFQLENFVQFLGRKEREAFEMLKENSVLKDEELEPAIRVALRSIKDFAFPFEYQDKLYWRFIKVSQDQAIEKISSKGLKEVEKKPESFEKEIKQDGEKIENTVEKPKIEEKNVPLFQKIKQAMLPRETLENKPLIEKGIETRVDDRPLKEQGFHLERKTEFVEPREEVNEKTFEENKEKGEEKPLLKIKKSDSKLKDKSDFVFNVGEFLENKNFVISKEIDWKKREYIAEVKGDTNLGKVIYHVIAKDKKSITDNDLLQAIQTCQDKKMPVILVSKGEPNRRAQEKLDEARNLVFFMKMS
jgi:hypothetical protein